MITHTVSKKEVCGANYRFDAGYHLSDGVTIRRNISKAPYSTMKVSEATEKIFYGLRANRVYVSKKDHALPFMTGANIMLSDLSNTKLVSKKYTPEIEEMTLHSDWILITRSGTVGLTAWSNKLYEGKYGSEDIIRVIPNNKIKAGVLYAFLASKYGYSLLTQGSFGAVIQHIEPNFVGNIDIPILPSDLQSNIDVLVRESAKLREEAAKALNDAKQILKDFIHVQYDHNNYKTGVVSSKDIWNSLQHRLDTPALINDGVLAMKEITERLSHSTIGAINAKVSRPGIFKRNYVADGIPYIKGSEIFLNNPFRRCEHLSRTRTPFIDEMTLFEGQILITCAGSVGNIKIITKEYEDKKAIGSQDIIRLVSTDKLYTREYLFTYLQMPFVFDYIQSMKYGSVIERIEPFHVESIPVVTPTEEISVEISTSIKRYMDCTYQAFNAEEKAITMIEEEIAKWNK